MGIISPALLGLLFMLLADSPSTVFCDEHDHLYKWIQTKKGYKINFHFKGQRWGGAVDEHGRKFTNFWGLIC